MRIWVANRNPAIVLMLASKWLLHFVHRRGQFYPGLCQIHWKIPLWDPSKYLRVLLPEFVKLAHDRAFRINLRVLSSDSKLHWPMIKLNDGHGQSHLWRLIGRLQSYCISSGLQKPAQNLVKWHALAPQVLNIGFRPDCQLNLFKIISSSVFCHKLR